MKKQREPGLNLKVCQSTMTDAPPPSFNLRGAAFWQHHRKRVGLQLTAYSYTPAIRKLLSRMVLDHSTHFLDRLSAPLLCPTGHPCGNVHTHDLGEEGAARSGCSGTPTTRTGSVGRGVGRIGTHASKHIPGWGPSYRRSRSNGMC